MTPLLTVITIARNAESTIGGTMESVLTQSYPNLEYVVIDGHSTDGTLGVVAQEKARHPNRIVKVWSEPDNGIADAMNKGVERSRGELIIHLHAGDRFIGADIVARVVASYEREQWRWGVASAIVKGRKGDERHVYRPAASCDVLLKKNSIPHQATFLVSDVFRKHGGFDPTLSQAMDYEFWLRLAFLGGERYRVLPFATTYFLEGGRSSNIRDLLRYLIIVRRRLRQWVPGLTWFDDIVFLARVVAFSVLSRLPRATFDLLFAPR